MLFGKTSNELDALLVQNVLGNIKKVTELPSYMKLFMSNQINKTVLSCVPNFEFKNAGSDMSHDNYS
jgi:hypothetical protein